MSTLIGIVLAALALMSVGLLKSYRHVSEKELKRRAREGDELATALYKAVSYGSSLNAVLWFVLIMANTLFFVWVARTAPAWFAIAASAALLWFAFVWMPAREVTRFSTWAAVKLAPFFAWLLAYISPLLDRVGEFIDKRRPVIIHTGLYDREDLVNLIHDQKVQPNNRIDKVSLDIAMHALTFGDSLVRDIMTPRRVVKMVSLDETVGPVLMSELHSSGFSRFPVYDGKADNIVGTLYLKDLVKAKTGGKIAKIYRDDLAYIHEEQALTDALQAIVRTHKLQYIVVNSFEEYVGIVTLEDVMERIIGKPIIDEFDQYDDLRAVAARAAREEHTAHLKDQKAETDKEPANQTKQQSDSEKPSNIAEGKNKEEQEQD